jgi:hypothetical protein
MTLSVLFKGGTNDRQYNSFKNLIQIVIKTVPGFK